MLPGTSYGVPLPRRRAWPTLSLMFPPGLHGRPLPAALVTAAISLIAFAIAPIAPAPLPAAGQVGSCQFILGFADLRDLLGPELVGECLDNQSAAPNGDALQPTTHGLLVWRKADNWTAFTDGSTTWVNGPEGVQQRLNSERLPWEMAPQPTPFAIPTPTPFPTVPPLPTATPAPAFSGTPVVLVEQGFGRGTGNVSSREVGYAFLVSNPNPYLTALDVGYQVVLYDAAGVVVGTDQGLVRRVLPGQRLGIGNRVYANGDAAPARMETRLTTGGYAREPAAVALVRDAATYRAGRVGGNILNDSDLDAPLVLVTAISYDAAGQVVGGGSGQAVAVPARGRVAVEVPVVTTGVPQRVELYAWLATY